MVNFPTEQPGCNCSFGCVFIFSPQYLFYSGFPSLLGNSGHIDISIYFDFPSNKERGFPFSLHNLCSCADWDHLHDDLRDVLWEDVYKLGVCTAGTEFCEWVQVGIDVYIPHRKYQVKLFIDFQSNSKGKGHALFHRKAYDYSCGDWDGQCDHLREVSWENTFKLGTSAVASEL